MNLRQPKENESSFRYLISYGSVRGPHGLPLVKPPYSRITAYELNKGEILWQVPHGDGPRYHPAIRQLETGPLGHIGENSYLRGGGILTGGLFIAIQFRDPTYGVKKSLDGGLLNAFDQDSGQHVWQFEFDGFHPLGTQMTYLHQGRQYLVVAGSGKDNQGELIALTLGK